MPTTVVFVLRPPYWTWRLRDISGWIATMYVLRSCSAVASSMVSGARSVADATRPAPRACPGVTVSSVVPRAAMRSFTDCWAPRPSATIAITAATPMTMPSMVRNERSLFARSASTATCRVSLNSILPSSAPAASAAGAAPAWSSRYAASQPLAKPTLILTCAWPAARRR